MSTFAEQLGAFRNTEEDNSLANISFSSAPEQALLVLERRDANRPIRRNNTTESDTGSTSSYMSAVQTFSSFASTPSAEFIYTDLTEQVVANGAGDNVGNENEGEVAGLDFANDQLMEVEDIEMSDAESDEDETMEEEVDQDAVQNS